VRKTYRCDECGKRRVGVTVVGGRDLCPECAEGGTRMNEAVQQAVTELLAEAETKVVSASRLVPHGHGAAGENIHQLLLDTAEKIGYVMGLVEDEVAASVTSDG
jgi:hypothetical protein